MDIEEETIEWGKTEDPRKPLIDYIYEQARKHDINPADLEIVITYGVDEGRFLIGTAGLPNEYLTDIILIEWLKRVRIATESDVHFVRDWINPEAIRERRVYVRANRKI